MHWAAPSKLAGLWRGGWPHGLQGIWEAASSSPRDSGWASRDPASLLGGIKLPSRAARRPEEARGHCQWGRVWPFGPCCRAAVGAQRPLAGVAATAAGATAPRDPGRWSWGCSGCGSDRPLRHTGGGRRGLSKGRSAGGAVQHHNRHPPSTALLGSAGAAGVIIT